MTITKKEPVKKTPAKKETVKKETVKKETVKKETVKKKVVEDKVVGMFDTLKAKIHKANKGIHCEVMSESNIATVSSWVPFPTYDLNRIVSGNLFKGIPEKSLTLLVGAEHTFKSSLAVLTAKSALKEGFKPIIFDTEGGITGEFAKRWGLDLEKCLYVYSPWIEEIKSSIAQIKESQEQKFCIILDSIGGLDKIKSYDDAVKGDFKSDMGQLARAIKSTLKILVNVIKTQNSIGVITSHFYSSSGIIPMPDSVVGGKAVLLLPDIIIYLKKAGKTDTTKSGADKLINTSTIKNRFYPTNKFGQVSINYEDGIDDFAGMIEIAVDMDIIEKKGGGNYSYKNDLISRGYENVLLEISSNKNLKSNILNDIDKKLENSGYSTLKEVELKDEIGKNKKDILDK